MMSGVGASGMGNYLPVVEGRFDILLGCLVWDGMTCLHSEFLGEHENNSKKAMSRLTYRALLGTYIGGM
jgi:hypothetical protein